jgi:hypothetical protein
MPQRRSKPAKKTTKSKVGEDRQAAKRFADKNDFGARESNRPEREYASRAAKAQDPGASPPRSGEDGARVSGAGSHASGAGAGSGGDLDTDIVGVGTGGSGVAASGKIHDPSGPDDSDGTSNEFAAPGPKGHARRRQHGASESVKGTTIDRSGGDVSTTAPGQGAASMGQSIAGHDDASAGEISNDEAAGADNSPSDNA